MYTNEFPFATPAYDESIQLRHEVLRKPLGISFEASDLAEEYNQIHLGCYSDSGKLLACLVLLIVDDKMLKMRQVAVDPLYHKKGIGSELVAASEVYAATHNYKTMALHARVEAVPFYLRLGYKKVGKVFTEVGIKHYKMKKQM
ncbi:MAG: putative GNAT family N-acyltransferase [Polaribacter sp.]|jgi:predicted GNAT family N-acyltransferase